MIIAITGILNRDLWAHRVNDMVINFSGGTRKLYQLDPFLLQMKTQHKLKKKHPGTQIASLKDASCFSCLDYFFLGKVFTFLQVLSI